MVLLGFERQTTEAGVVLTANRLLAFIKNPFRWMVFSSIVFGLSLVWIWASAVPISETTGGRIPSPHADFLAPDFTLDRMGGGQITLSDLGGQVVVLNLWASWCAPCRAEMPALEKVYRTNRERGLTVLAVNITSQDREADAAAFTEQFGLTFPVALDQRGEVARLYLMQALPTTFFIDAEGVIRKVVVGGPMSEVTMQTAVESLLEVAP